MPGPPAATWMDLVVGVDIHIVLVPSPGGPVPTPLPHPYLGLTGDPVGAAIAAAVAPLVSLCSGGGQAEAKGSVLINGLPRLTTADLSHNTSLLPHFPTPPGTGFAKAPTGDGIHKLGSMTVMAGGAGAVRLGELVMSCSDPSPLPTSTVITMPKGAPVLVGGPSGVNVAAAARGAIANRIFRTAWRGAGAAFKFAGRYAGRRLRTWVESARCFFTGHPVDVATGCVVTDALDVELSGDLSVEFRRSYSSGWAGRRGPLGHGWSHSLDRALWFEPDGAVVRLGDGRELIFATDDLPGGTLAVRGEIRDPITGFTLTRPSAARWRVIDPTGVVDEFVHVDGNADQTALTDGVYRVVRSTRRHGKHPIEFIYAGGQLEVVRDANGRALRFVYDSQGRITIVRAPHPEQPDAWVDQTTFLYSADGDLVEARDVLGNATRYEYQGHLMTGETRRNGVSFHWAYDGLSSNARCIRTWGRSGDEVIFNQKLLYDPRGRRTVVLDSYGNASEYIANELNLIVQIRDPEGRCTKLEYDEHLHLVAEIDPLGYSTRTTYDPFGRPRTTTSADGVQTEREYHHVFRELETGFRDGCGGLWRREYDERGRLRRVLGPEFARDLVWNEGRVIAIQEGRHRTEIEYDRRGFVATVRQPAGAETHYSYDQRGRVVRRIGPAGARTEIAYDLLDQPVRVHWPDGEVSERRYDPEGNIVEERSGAGTVFFEYGNFDRVVSRERAGIRETYAWGQEGELREIRNARRQAWTFEYDPGLRLRAETGFDLQRTRYKRDAAGRIVEKATTGRVTKFEYDALDRVVGRTHADGAWEKFSYRADGRLVCAENQDTKIMIERDALGRVTREQQGDDWVGTSQQLGEGVVLESSRGARMSVVHDDSGNPSRAWLGDPRAGAAEIGFSYDEEGREVGRDVPGNVSVRIERDVLGRPRLQSAEVQGVECWHREYTWNHDQLIGTRDSHFGQFQFRYDATGAPVAADLDGRVQFRTRDNLGNVYRAGNLSDRSFARGGRIREASGETLGFTSAGLLSSRTEADGKRWSYHWNAAGTLAAIDRPDGLTVRFTYDALGRRVAKTVGVVQTRWLWSGNSLLHEMTEGNTTTWYREPGGLGLLAQFTDGKHQHVITDHLGTPAVAFDEHSRIAWRMQLDLYGVPQAGRSGTNDPAACPWRWPGQYADGDADLYYNRFRYYDPRLGAYISPDPIGVDGGLALYAYVADPLTWIDPLGLAGWVFDPTRDADLSGGKGTYRDALDEAFRRTGIPRDKFQVSQWQRTVYGKSMPAQWHSPSGAIVGVDDPSLVGTAHGPALPHVGYQTPGKRRTGQGKRGHILLDAVPVSRSPLGCGK